ncbi:sulfate transporter 1.3-like [Wolffia australiana]
MGRSVSDSGEGRDSDIAGHVSSRRQGGFARSTAYKVGLPRPRTLASEFKDTMKETFLHDDPLRPFKGQTTGKKIWLGVESFFPILSWGRKYNLRKFRGDLIAGLTIASLCIPQDIAYSKLANLDPQYGLYTSFVPPLVYAFMGSSGEIAIGPVAVVSLLLGTLLRNEIDPVKQKAEYLRLAFTATFFAGIVQAGLGFFRLGFIIDFLSHAAIVGFMAGAAVTIALQQLKGFLGIKTFTTNTDIISVMKSVWKAVHHGWNWQTIVIALSCFLFLLAAKYIGKKSKKYIWVPALAPLTAVILSTTFVYITRADKKGVAIVKNIRKGINPSSVDQIYFTGSYMKKGFQIGLVAGLVALTEAAAIGRTFAAIRDYHLDGNKEMVALGSMNIIGSMTSCYIATGSFSRSAVNFMTGCETPVSNIIMSVVVLLTLKFITPLFKYTPNAVLAAIIINAVLGLIDYDEVVRLWKVDKLDFLACTGAFLGVVFKSVEIGLLVAVIISFAKIIFNVTRPRTALLGNIPGTNIYRNVEQYPEAVKVPGLMIIRVDSAIYFSNSNYVRERILRWLTDEQEYAAENKLPQIEFVIVELSPVINIDTSGIQAFEDLFKALQRRGIQLVLANPAEPVMEKFFASKFIEVIGEDKIFLTAGEAVHACAPKHVTHV